METPVIGSHYFQVLILCCSREHSVGGVYRILWFLKLARPVPWNSSKNTKTVGTGIMMFLPHLNYPQYVLRARCVVPGDSLKYKLSPWLTASESMLIFHYSTLLACRWRHMNACEQSYSLGWIHTVGVVSTRLMTQPLVQREQPAVAQQLGDAPLAVNGRLPCVGSGWVYLKAQND